MPVNTNGKTKANGSKNNGISTETDKNNDSKGDKGSSTTSDQQKSSAEGGGATAGGLDLLASLALPVGKNAPNNATQGAMLVGGIDISTTGKRPKKKSSRSDDMNPKEKLYVDTVRDVDVLCGRGGTYIAGSFDCDDDVFSRNASPLLLSGCIIRTR